MSVKKSVIKAVAMIDTVDKTGINMMFPAQFVHDSQRVEFDVYEGGSEIALKGSFGSQANIVKKDGYKTLSVNPMQVNESITDSGANINKQRIGQDEYGKSKGGVSTGLQRQIEDDAKGFAKLKKRAERLLKKSCYDVAITGKLVVSADNGVVDEIDYGLTNKIVNDAAADWNNVDANPVEQLESESLKMKKYSVNTYIMGSEARLAFMKNPNVQTSDNITTGKKANFTIASVADIRSKSTDTFLFMGTTNGTYGKSVELYAEIDVYNDGTQDVDYFDKNYCVGFRKGNADNAQIQFGNIPVTSGDGQNAEIKTFVGREHLDGRVSINPVGVERFYRTSPLPTMNQPKAFISIKATRV